MIKNIFDLYDETKLDTYLKQINRPELKNYIKEILNNTLTLEILNKILKADANIKWNNEKKEKAYLYNDNYKKTIRFLKAETSFKKAINCLNYYEDYKKILEENSFNNFNNLLKSIHNQIHTKGTINEINKEQLSLYLKMYNIISKENYIKEKINQNLNDYKNIFMINPSSYIIKKEQEKQKRIKLLKLYKNNNINILNKLNTIKKRYINEFDNIIEHNELEFIINNFIKQIIEMKVKKTNDIIKESENNYYYLDYIFKKIRRDIMKLAFTLKDENIQNVNKDSIIFNDKNYIFNKEKLKEISIEKLNKIIKYFAKINNNNKKLLIENGLIMYYLLCNDDYSQLEKLLQNIDEIENYCKNFDIKNLPYIFELNNLIEKGNIYLSMLGFNVLEKTQKNTSYTYEKLDKKIKTLCDIVKTKYNINSSTIPYVEGQYEDLYYSVYDKTKNDVLTCGIDTNTCLKACGTENDFFHYTILSKNGINLKIYDKNNKLIARVSGNRHGNGLYFNQLRLAPNIIINEDKIINTFKQACKDIIKQSKDEEKIEFVMINKSHLTKNIESNIEQDLTYYIALNCVDNKSKDWQEFIKNKNLEESYHGTFLNDYGTTELICIESIIGKINKEKIKFYSAQDFYKRKRNRINISKINNEYEQKINRIKSINCYENNLEYKFLKTKSNQYIITGDNWYILFDDTIIDSCCLKNDKQACIECSIGLEYIKEILNKKNIIKRKTIFS